MLKYTNEVKKGEIGAKFFLVRISNLKETKKGAQKKNKNVIELTVRRLLSESPDGL